MRRSSISRYGALTGMAFVVLLIIVRLVEGSLPSADDSTASVIAFWHDNRDEQIFVAILASLAGALFVWFAGVLRGTLREGGDEGMDTLATISFGGALIAMVGLFLGTTLEFAAADTVGDVPVTVTQTLSALQADSYFPIAAGFAIFQIATGMALLQLALLPRWMAIASIVFGIVWLTPLGFVGILFTVIFVAWTSLALYRGEAELATV